MTKAAEATKTIILCVGNELMRDEGVGVHVARILMQHKLPVHVEVIEGGTDGFGLLNIITEADRLIIVDALKGGSPPGTIYQFNIDEVPSTSAIFKTSIHQISILEVVHLSGLIGKTPVTTVIGIEPATISMGMELSDTLKNKLPRIVELIMAQITENSVGQQSQMSLRTEC